MGTTSFGITYPDSTSTVDWVGDMQTLANNVNTNLDAIVAPGWTSYVPAWTSSGTAPAIGNGTRTGRWRRIANDDLITVQIKFVFGSTSTYGTGDWSFGLPVNAHTDDTLQGWGHVYQFATIYRPMVSRKNTVSSVYLISTAGATGLVTATVPHTWANQHEVYLTLSYQPA